MITELRRTLKSSVYKVFLWIFLAVILFGGFSTVDFSDNKPWAIKVYKHKATELDYRQAVSHQQQQLDYLKAQGISWPRTESVEKEVLRHMVTNLLMQEVAQNLELVVPSMQLQEQLASQLQSLPAHFFDAYGNLKIDMLEKIIAPRTFDSFLDEMENEIKSSLLYNVISIGSYVPQFEVALQYSEEFAAKTYSILTFSLQKALTQAKANEASRETLEKFYKKNDHGDIYKTVEKRAGKYWRFQASDYGLSISNQEISAYYDKNKQAEFLDTPAQVQVHRIFFSSDDSDKSFDARQQAQIIHEELKQDPSKFADVAKKIKTTKVKTQGSEKTEFFAKDSKDFDPIFVETAFEQLSQDGDISNVIKTDKGYEILQRVARKSAKYKSLDEEKTSIEKKLLADKFTKRFKQDAERVVSNAGYDNQGLENFINKRNGQSESLSLDAKKPGLLHMQLFQTNEGDYAIFMEGKDGILLQCTQVQKRALKPFDEIKDTVASDYYRKQAQQNLVTIAKDAMNQSLDKSFDDIAKEYGAHLEVAQANFNDGSLELDAILKRPDISQKIKSLQYPGDMIDIVTATESYVVRLDSVKDLDEKVFNEKRSAIKKSLTSKAKYKGRDSFIASLYRHAKLNSKIEIRDQLIKNM